MSARRLTTLADVTGPAALPGYDPAAHGCGIVHLGAGAFHRAHQAVCTDDALARSGGDWRIVGVSLRGTGVADALNPQNGLYTLIERGAEGTRARVLASIDRVVAASRDRTALLAAMTDPRTRIVSLTVTEKAYGIDRTAMDADAGHPAVAADLLHPHAPQGVLGLIVEGLRLRRIAGTPPFTVLCCDNLPDNGALLAAGVVGFARRIDPDLAEWIAGNVAFPSSMVDRITPAATDETRAEAGRQTGCDDHGAIETEAFTQWVIEDRFPAGRPDWEAGGALFVADVKPYEQMKLRMLNGAHSMLAYAGFLSGHVHVRDVMGNAALVKLIERHMRAAAATLPPLQGIDLETYRADLLARFGNPAIAHQTFQIAMDGTEKLPQRILGPAAETLATGGNLRPFAFAVAAWMRYCLGRGEDGTSYALRDPREAGIASAVDGKATAEGISAALHALPGLFPQPLSTDPSWRAAVTDALATMLRVGMAAAIDREAGTLS
ncbi:D-mannonate oxidoreductase [Zhengella mangrovi]|uniref:D-mannonate oxidoreductase n=1 Tax=Zhengella mangrovi TaxID=1982044 RepID=A0A2G1QQE2_9HYPH|nr:mannitol dehydrogenase family protein [Zhengella mangrovi]PHP67681.1 D-mannonate oxidoreductase [Zhengella mangrovi]